jgi:hypothetical protein
MRVEEMNAESIVEARRARSDINLADFDHEEWARASAVRLTRYWSGEAARPTRQAEARLLWDERALSARFKYEQHEAFIVSERPQLEEKALGLWDRDVCEMFVAPRADEPQRYFEFEVAPTGEWLDLAIRKTADGRETDWDFRSGMTAAARINGVAVTLVLRVPWEAFARAATAALARPQVGECWRVNLFRCVGAGAERGYLAWQPTLTPEPNFHVPEKFGWLRFGD